MTCGKVTLMACSKVFMVYCPCCCVRHSGQLFSDAGHVPSRGGVRLLRHAIRKELEVCVEVMLTLERGTHALELGVA